jgi:hypothetical protein
LASKINWKHISLTLRYDADPKNLRIDCFGISP